MAWKRSDASPSGPGARHWRRLQQVGLRTKLAVPIVLLAVVPAITIGAFAMSRLRVSLGASALDRIESETKNKATGMGQFLTDVEDDLRFLARGRVLRELAGTADRMPRAVLPLAPLVEDELLTFSQGRRGYYQIRYINQQGQEIVRLNSYQGRPRAVPPEELQDKGSRYYVAAMLRTPPGQVYVSPLDLNEEFGRVESPDRWVVRYGMRVSDPQGTSRGVLVINLDVVELFSTSGPLAAGSRAFLVDARGDELCDLFPVGPGSSPRLTPDGRARLEGRLTAGSGSGSFATRESIVSFAAISTGHSTPSVSPWLLVLTRPRGPVDAPVRQMVAFMVVLTALLAAASTVIGILVASYFVRPITKLRDAVHRAGRGDLTTRVSVETGDEIEVLGREFNQMAEQLSFAQSALGRWNAELSETVERRTEELRRLQAGMARVDKLSSLGQMTAAVMHEVGNPLAAIKSRIQLEIERDPRPSAYLRTLQGVLEEVERLTLFLRTCARWGRFGAVPFQDLPLAEVVRGLQTIVRLEEDRRQLRVVFDVSGDTPSVHGNADQLRQLLLNLILNAMDASPAGSEIVVSTGPSQTGVAIAVRDAGHGMTDEIVRRAGEPFFTTKSDGTGLGLAVCRQILQEHHGTMTIESRPGGGTMVTVLLPIAGGTTRRPQEAV